MVDKLFEWIMLPFLPSPCSITRIAITHAVGPIIFSGGKLREELQRVVRIAFDNWIDCTLLSGKKRQYKLLIKWIKHIDDEHSFFERRGRFVIEIDGKSCGYNYTEWSVSRRKQSFERGGRGDHPFPFKKTRNSWSHQLVNRATVSPPP